MNGTAIEGAGVRFVEGGGGWVEIGGVVVNQTGVKRVGVVGGGEGKVRVVGNWLGEGGQVVDLSGTGTTEVGLELLEGRNVVTVWQEEGAPWVDAIVVGEW